MPRRRAPYSGIVVFGTSLSDSGNAFALHGDANTPPDYLVDPLLVPSAPYAKGGHHFSNGATWVEQFARSLGLAGSVQAGVPQRRAEPQTSRSAAARAWADGQNVNLSDQVDAFLQSTGGTASPDALYVIEMGGNDVRDALGAYPAGHVEHHRTGARLDRLQRRPALRRRREAVPRLERSESGADAGASPAGQRQPGHRAAGDVPDAVVQRQPWRHR